MEEARLHYEKAKRKGLRAVNIYKANGWNPNLPSLDASLSRQAIMSEVNLGLQEIQIKKIKGTRTQARSSSFAPNFMPILGNLTEFGSKWMHLYKAHMTEGIRDPIKVYEYLNWYYVEEGNKRVSVLKYNDASLVAANVIRLIPKYDKDNETIVIYYEFMEFYKKMQVNYIWFSEVGSFDKLYKWIEKYNWHLEENEGEFRKNYHLFRREYVKLGGDKLPITTGDAFLKYLEVYPFREGIEEVVASNIRNIWKELTVISKDTRVDLELNDASLEKRTIFSGLTSMSTALKQAKIAFVHAKNQEDSAWTYGHEIGRLHLDHAYGDAVTTKCFDNVPEDERAYDHFAKIAEEGYDVIFATSPAFIHETLKASMKYDQVKFLNCSESLSYRHLRTYFGRIYEPNFLVGMIAGAMTRTNQLGYAVTYPIPEVISSINAYALGARFMNPFAKVFVKWVNDGSTNETECYAIDQQFVDMGCDIICHQESTDLKTSLNHTGIYFANDLQVGKSIEGLASPIWNWGTFYEKIVGNIMSGNYNRISGFLGINDRAISYWWGMDSGVVDVMYSKSKLPEPLIKSVEFMKSMIVEGHTHPFSGPIYDQKGLLRIEEGTHLDNEDILSMNWFVDGVVGSIPSIDGMKDDHKLLELFGVKKKY